jgi:hypothetical protein
MPRRLVRGAGLLGENRLDPGGVAENWAVQIRSAPTRETGQRGGAEGFCVPCSASIADVSMH